LRWEHFLVAVSLDGWRGSVGAMSNEKAELLHHYAMSIGEKTLGTENILWLKAWKIVLVFLYHCTKWKNLELKAFV
jgi:hypothetical protein